MQLTRICDTWRGWLTIRLSWLIGRLGWLAGRLSWLAARLSWLAGRLSWLAAWLSWLAAWLSLLLLLFPSLDRLGKVLKRLVLLSKENGHGLEVRIVVAEARR